VIFAKWFDGQSTLSYYSPSSSKKEFSAPMKQNSHFTKTVFLPGTERAVTGTEGGDILVWEVSKIKTGIGSPGDRKLEKVVTLNPDVIDKSHFVAINILLTVDDTYLVCGNQDGTIRFYDFGFKAEAWFEGQNLSTIKSISFSKRTARQAKGPKGNDSYHEQDGQQYDSNSFACSDFLVADSNGVIAEFKSTMFEAIETKDKQSKTIMYGIKSPISAIAVHPNQSIIAVASDDGFIGIYDYLNNFERKALNHINIDQKKDEKLSSQPTKPKSQMTKEELAAEKKRAAMNRVVTCMEFTPNEGELLIGLSKGEIKIIDGDSFQIKKLPQELVTSEESKKDVIKQLVVTCDGKYFATSDSRNCVCLFKKDHFNEDEKDEISWFFTGKILSHQVEITSICFGQSLGDDSQMQHRLFSVGRDRRCFEYDVAAARMNDKLPVLRHFDIELESHPTACIWYPDVEDLNEGWLLTANDEYKMKLWNPTTTHSRRTCLGPTYGGEITKMKLLDQGEKDKYLLY
jgi:cilia- and flagella-associated protein 251